MKLVTGTGRRAGALPKSIIAVTKKGAAAPREGQSPACHMTARQGSTTGEQDGPWPRSSGAADMKTEVAQLSCTLLLHMTVMLVRCILGLKANSFGAVTCIEQAALTLTPSSTQKLMTVMQATPTGRRAGRNPRRIGVATIIAGAVLLKGSWRLLNPSTTAKQVTRTGDMAGRLRRSLGAAIMQARAAEH